MSTSLTLPRVHADDWQDRFSFERGIQVTHRGDRSITLSLSNSDIEDLADDAAYYVSEMYPGGAGTDYDMRPAARACLRALARLGFKHAADTAARRYDITYTD